MPSRLRLKKKLILALLLMIPFGIIGCKEALLYPILETKLKNLQLTSKDLTIFAGANPFPSSVPLASLALARPLLLPDQIQKTSEKILVNDQSLLPLDPSLLKELFPKSFKKPSKVKNNGLEKVLKRLERKYKSQTDYSELLYWLESQPESLTKIIALLIDGILDANQDIEKAFKKLTPEEKKYIKEKTTHLPFHVIGEENTKGFDGQLLLIAQKINIPYLYKGTFQLVKALELAKKHSENEALPYLISEPFSLDTPLGKLIIGSLENDHFEEPGFLMIDFGGNDNYRFETASEIESPTSLIVDFKGNEIYSNKQNENFGGKILGISLLLDLEGHDFYSSQDFSLGSGVFGSGLLIDLAGDDEYRIKHFGIGAGFFGLGLLYDHSGNDYYSGKHYSEGFSMTDGIGLLIDRGGNDFYSAGGDYDGWSFSEDSYKSSSQGFSMGIRGYAPGGVALLLDGSGNDSYHGAALCQGVGYWYGLGILHDLMGNDFYSSVHYGQGAGVHFGVGALLDNEGSDFYKTVAASQGLGYHRSIGILVDYKGNDSYHAKKLSGGAASLTGIGILNDQEGDDNYQLGLPRSNSLGFGTTDNKIDSIGLFFDEEGQDNYLHSHYFQNVDEKTKRRGLRSDGNQPLDIFRYKSLYVPLKAKKKKELIDRTVPDFQNPDQPEVIFQILSDPMASASSKTEAHQAFLRMDDKAIAFLMDAIASKSFVKSDFFASRYLPAFESKILPLIIDRIYSEKKDPVRARFILSLSFFRDRPTVLKHLRQQAIRKQGPISKAAVLAILAKLEDRNSEKFFLRNLKSPHPYVVLNSIEGINNLKTKKAIPPLTKLLDHSYYLIRDRAAAVLDSMGDDAISYLREEYPDASPLKKTMIDRIFDDYRKHAR